MITWADYLSQAERRKDEMAQAEQHRLRLQVAKRHSPLLKGFRPLLVRLGGLLVTWGYRLQAQNASRSSVP
jgi:hypothetical protein